MDLLKLNISKKLYASLPSKLRDTVALRAFGFFKVPLIFYVGPTVMELNDRRCVIKIPLNRRTRNHLNSMYFGTMAIGADCAGGLMGMYNIATSGRDLALIFKDFKAEYLKRPESDVIFTCEDGPATKDMIDRAIATGERQNLSVKVVATVPDKFGDQPVAKFELTLSVKLR